MPPRAEPAACAPDQSPSTVYRLPEAARLLGISGPTLKQWIYRGRVKSVQTPGGHHRIPRAEIDRLNHERDSRSIARLTAGVFEPRDRRNELRGTVTRVRVDGRLAEVTMTVGSEQLTAIIPSSSCRALGLLPGVPAVGLVRASEVMIVRA